MGLNAFRRELLLPPENSFHRRGRSPSLEEGGLGASRSLSKPLIQPRVQGRNPARFNGGYGVPRGFKGEKSKFPPNPLGLAERVPSSADDDSPFSKQQQHNQQLQTHLTVAIPEFLPQNTVFPKNRLLHFICFICFMCPVCVGRKKIFGVKATGSNSFHRPRGGPPPSKREVLGEEKSRVCRMSAGARCANSFHRCGGPPPSRREVWGFAGQGLRPCRRLHIGALRSPL